MPGSELAKFEWCVPKIMYHAKKIRPLRILDVGAGSGLLADYLAKEDFGYRLDAIEVWLPYVNEFNLREKYNTVFTMDAREFSQWSDYDLVMFGDVLEHMPKQEAIDLWDSAIGARYRMLSIPTVHCPQGEEHGNPYEVHVKDDWTHEEVLSSFSGIVDYSPQYALVRAYST
jgi:hypothetical protein